MPSGLVWEQFFAQSRLWVKWFSKGGKLNEFYVPFFSIICLIYHLNPYCYSPFLITSVEKEQFRIRWIMPKKVWPMQNLAGGLAQTFLSVSFYLRTVREARGWFPFSLLSTLMPLFFCYCCFALKGSVCILRIVFSSQVNCSLLSLSDIIQLSKAIWNSMSFSRTSLSRCHQEGLQVSE